MSRPGLMDGDLDPFDVVTTHDGVRVRLEPRTRPLPDLVVNTAAILVGVAAGGFVGGAALLTPLWFLPAISSIAWLLAYGWRRFREVVAADLEITGPRLLVRTYGHGWSRESTVRLTEVTDIELTAFGVRARSSTGSVEVPLFDHTEYAAYWVLCLLRNEARQYRDRQGAIPDELRALVSAGSRTASTPTRSP